MKVVLVSGLLLSLGLASCVSVRVGPDEDFLEVKGLANVHGSVRELNEWDGTLLDFGLFTNTRGRNELVSVEVGPLAGVGLGVVGARARVLPFEFGVGSLFYDPRPAARVEARPEEEVDEIEEIEAEGPPSLEKRYGKSTGKSSRTHERVWY